MMAQATNPNPALNPKAGKIVKIISWIITGVVSVAAMIYMWRKMNAVWHKIRRHAGVYPTLSFGLRKAHFAALKPYGGTERV
jgi:poly(3-hydroxybutyrate) depolymerase